ncbi:hypothetical protein ALC53_02596 [Atta colombica]|uniref:Uncharacterized protein n=1 Tax=Atta colombica TaxID=520822 RepID=A0A195BQI3_9HYME|nr:hypothetical protein ALC53_02596 [Atta colombica]
MVSRFAETGKPILSLHLRSPFAYVPILPSIRISANPRHPPQAVPAAAASVTTDPPPANIIRLFPIALNCGCAIGKTKCFNDQMDLATTAVSTHSQEEMQGTLPLVRDTSQVWVLLRTIPTGFSVTSTVWLGTLPLSKRVTENELGAIIGLPHSESRAGRLRILAALTAGRPPATQLQVDSPDRPVARIRCTVVMSENVS